MKIRGFEYVSNNEWYKFGNDNDRPILPKRMTKHAACYDIFIKQGFVLLPNQEIKIPTGFKIYMMEDECFEIYPRSGLGFKYYARLANSTGIIDSDYYNNIDNEGHCFVKIRNEGSETMVIKDETSIAQGKFSKYLLADGDEVNNERVGGLGSTTK